MLAEPFEIGGGVTEWHTSRWKSCATSRAPPKIATPQAYRLLGDRAG